MKNRRLSPLLAPVSLLFLATRTKYALWVHAEIDPQTRAQSSSMIRGAKPVAAFHKESLVSTLWHRWLQWPQYTGTNPFTTADDALLDDGASIPQASVPAIDATNMAPQGGDPYAYASPVMSTSSTGKGKGAIPPVQDDFYYTNGKGSTGKGKGAMPPIQQDDYYYPHVPPGKGKGGSTGKGKGSMPPPQLDDYVNPYVPPGKGTTGKGTTGKGTTGKGKGGMPSPQDDYYYAYGKGKGGSTGKGKGWMPPQVDDFVTPYVPPGKGKGSTGKGKGAMPPEGDDYYYSYGKGKGGSTGKGKGWMPPQQDDYYYGPGKGKGGYSTSNCLVPYNGYGPIPQDTWLDQDGCLHALPPAPPSPSFEPLPIVHPVMQPLRSPVADPYVPPSPVAVQYVPPSAYNTMGEEALPLPTSLTYQPPTPFPSLRITENPTIAPTVKTSDPTESPSSGPTVAPTTGPTIRPTSDPTYGSTSLKASSPSPSKAPQRTELPPTTSPSAKTEFPTELQSSKIIAGITVHATPFSLNYTLTTSSNLSERIFDDAAQTTLAYLQTFVEAFYNRTHFSFISFSGSQIANTGSPDPSRIGLDVSLVFNDNGRSVPSQANVDLAVRAAFSEPAVQTLLQQLSELGTSNSFSNTSSVTYSTLKTPAGEFTSGTNSDPSQGKQFASRFIISMVAAIGALIILAMVVAIVSRRRRRQRREEEEGNVAAKGFAMSSGRGAAAKSSSGDRTVCSGVVEFGSSDSSDSAVEPTDGASLFEEANQVE